MQIGEVACAGETCESYIPYWPQSDDPSTAKLCIICHAAGAGHIGDEEDAEGSWDVVQVSWVPIRKRARDSHQQAQCDGKPR